MSEVGHGVRGFPATPVKCAYRSGQTVHKHIQNRTNGRRVYVFTTAAFQSRRKQNTYTATATQVFIYIGALDNNQIIDLSHQCAERATKLFVINPCLVCVFGYSVSANCNSNYGAFTTPAHHRPSQFARAKSRVRRRLQKIEHNYFCRYRLAICHPCKSANNHQSFRT